MVPNFSRDSSMNPRIAQTEKSKIEGFEGRPWELWAKAAAFDCYCQTKIAVTFFPEGNQYYLYISGHMWTLEQVCKNWIYLVGESYFCIYLFTHEREFSFLWFINRSFKFKLAVSNHKSFILWKRKVQLRICIASPSVIKHHQAISCSVLEVTRTNGEG